ncbi:MAG: SurA N-terminal domain-containing protein [Candidatus Omnitrophica bacterium]|nr:SurA N-terminal domain-containing protein [Candidatus Omnitrophota bacterium]
MFKKLLHSKSVQRRAAWILIIMLVPPFILFFNTWMGGTALTGGETAGVVFGRHVPLSEFQEEYARLRQRLEDEVGPVPEVLEPWLRDQTWDRLILQAEAKRREKVSDQELAEFIRNQPAFQRDGRFMPEIYHQFIASRGMTPARFETRLRNELRITKLVNSATASVQMSDEELRRAWEEDRPASDDAEFAHEKEAFRTAALGGKQQLRFHEWLTQLRERAHLKNLLPPAPLSAAP